MKKLVQDAAAATIQPLDDLMSGAERPASRPHEQRMSRSAWRRAGFIVRPGERGRPEIQHFNAFSRTTLTYSRRQVEAIGNRTLPF